MNTREELIAGGHDGVAVVPGDSAASRFVHIVAGTDPDTMMPPKGRPLNAEEIGLIRAWIDQGAPWDEEAMEAYDGPLAPLNLQPAAPPSMADHPVDAFILAHLEERGMAPPAPVDDAVFMRRAYLDLIGLPPPPHLLALFVAARAPDKRARLIDGLLARDGDYAEHWISFWNDLLRNDFEGTGYIDGGRKQITPWLFEALASNRAYDGFVRELIDPVPESEGFIRGIIWRGEVNASQQPAVQASQNVSQVFLGVNLKCASCHDSFTDHWKLEDAYGLANVFSDTPMEMVRCDAPTGEMAVYKFLWPELGEIPASLTRQARQARVAELVTMEENGPFARTIVNRLWARLFGRGLVEPLDAIELPAWHPELLDWLAADLIAHDYDLRHLLRRITTSQTYQWPARDEEPDYSNEYRFEGPLLRRLSAEQFYDVLSAMTGAWQESPRFTPPERWRGREEMVRAWRVPADTLMRALGRPHREQVVSRREEEATTLQLLELTHGGDLSRAIARGAAQLREDLDLPAEALVVRLFRHGLQRDPAPAELAAARTLLSGPAVEESLEDFLWALAMLPEFQYIH